MSAAFVQSKSAGGNSTSAQAVFTGTPTQGNLLVAIVASASAGAMTMSSSGWTVGHQTNAGSGGSSRGIATWWKVAGVGESSTVTVTVPNSAWAIAIAEYSGIDPSSTLNIDNTQANASTQTQTTPTVTPSGSGNAVIVAGGMNRGLTVNTWSTEQVNSSATGVNEREDVVSVSPGCSICLYDKFVTGLTGTYAGVATQSGAATVGGGGILIFNEAAAGGGPTVKNFAALGVG